MKPFTRNQLAQMAALLLLSDKVAQRQGHVARVPRNRTVFNAVASLAAAKR